MAKPPSEDLRIRLIQAVEGGLLRRAAAERIGVSAASAVSFVSGARAGRQAPSHRVMIGTRTALRRIA